MKLTEKQYAVFSIIEPHTNEVYLITEFGRVAVIRTSGDTGYIEVEPYEKFLTDMKTPMYDIDSVLDYMIDPDENIMVHEYPEDSFIQDKHFEEALYHLRCIQTFEKQPIIFHYIFREDDDMEIDIIAKIAKGTFRADLEREASFAMIQLGNHIIHWEMA